MDYYKDSYNKNKAILGKFDLLQISRNKEANLRFIYRQSSINGKYKSD